MLSIPEKVQITDMHAGACTRSPLLLLEITMPARTFRLYPLEISLTFFVLK